ncbi:SOUL family heme-binding protein [Aliidiomarina celeris]|uniref:SOUL family heme-binding protein n=1 Tax=Aliidiomarina celeris TaxID=2249428 RepID=UPI000DE9E5A1|nr:heme-binding protein [Aliidiomarina celeris]
MAIFPAVVKATEEPEYEVLARYGYVELRRYEPMLVAETWVEGSMNNASGQGFQRLADFIFGNNRSVVSTNYGQREAIGMTSPVTLQPEPKAKPQSESQSIAMTAPVTLQPDGERWRVHFVMPSQYTVDTLPKPNNANIQIREVPATHYAVVAFSGWANADSSAQIANALQTWMLENGLTPIASPEVARYDPPWRKPFARRNEVMIAYRMD